MVGCKQSRRHLESVEDNFLVQLLDREARGEALLDLVLTSAENIIKRVEVGGSLGCSDHVLLESVIMRNMDLAKSKIRTLNSGEWTSNFLGNWT